MDQRTIKNALTLSALSALVLIQIFGGKEDLFSSLVNLIFHYLGTEAGVNDKELRTILLISFATSVVFAFSFISFVLFFMAIDFSGVWDQYLLQKNRTVTWRSYWQGMENFFFDFLFFFCPLNAILFYVHRDVIIFGSPWNPPPFDLLKEFVAGTEDREIRPTYQFLWQLTEPLLALLVVFIRVALGFVIGKIWSYFAHYTLHQKSLYRMIHKRHHVSTQEMVASHSWYESVPEFIVMELPNLFMAVILFPVHWVFICIYYIYHAFSGASDHSGFKVNWLINSEYHFLHHKQTLVNYGEFEILDLLFKTHHSFLPKFRAQAKSTEVATQTSVTNS